MHQQLRMKLDHTNRFLEANDREDIEKDMNIFLEEYLTDHGYPVGIRNITELDETGFAEARNNTFGASDSAVLLGVAYSSKKVPMKTKEELLHEKVNNVWNEEIGKLASVRKGKELEDFIIKKLEKILNAFILKPAHMYINEKGLATNFDGVLFEPYGDDKFIYNYEPIPLEIKLCTVWARKNYDWEKASSEFGVKINLEIPDDLPLQKDVPIADYITHKANHFGIPKYYYTQIQQQIMFTGADHGHLAVMDDSNWELFIFTIPRDKHVIDELLKESFHAYALLRKKKGLPLPE